MPLTVKPRVVSLLPSATDIMAALGAGDLLVGVSHSCDGDWAHLPVLTSTLIDKNAPAGDIDAQVKNSSGPLYELDIARLEALAPDIVISQDLCDVCAVPSGDVDDALKSLPTASELVTLAPFRLADIPVCFGQVGEVIGQMAAAESLQTRWAEALMACRGRFAEH
ncbi:MAG: cobalamin-binding protein, partial [Pseudomonadota bacterium]|nr:cobalamin-binding protein [Pseudomonadota bacterium]